MLRNTSGMETNVNKARALHTIEWQKIIASLMQIGFESSYHREFLLATQTACLSLKVVSIYIQVKEINWLQ